jgi:hypothetical protein
MVAPEQAADVVASSPTDAPSTAPRENPARRQSVRRAPSNSCQRGVRGAVGEAAVRIKPGTYARVPIWAAALGISGRAWDVLVAICMHVDNGALAYPSMKTIAGIVGIQRCKVPAEIKKLVAAGVLRKTDRKDERHGDSTSSLYRIISSRRRCCGMRKHLLPVAATLCCRQRKHGVLPEAATEQTNSEQTKEQISPLRARGGTAFVWMHISLTRPWLPGQLKTFPS